MKNFKIAILASGSGSTSESFFDKVALVISNNPHAGIIERAKSRGIDCIVLPKQDYDVYKSNGDIDYEASRLKYGASLLAAFRIYEIEYISQNGWSVMTPQNVVEAYPGKILNSHPAPLDPGHPDFGGVGMHGLAVHAAVLNFKKQISRPFDYTEVVLHYVTEVYDQGTVVSAAMVPVKSEDTPETLQQRVKEYEKEQNKAFWQHLSTGGKVVPLHRQVRLVLPNEVETLQEAKRRAIAQYPRG